MAKERPSATRKNITFPFFGNPGNYACREQPIGQLGPMAECACSHQLGGQWLWSCGSFCFAQALIAQACCLKVTSIGCSFVCYWIFFLFSALNQSI